MKKLIGTFALALMLAVFARAENTVPTDAKSRVEALRAALKGTDEAAKLSAVEGCGATPHAATAGALVLVLAKESDDLRAAATVALGKMEGIADASKVLHAAIGANLKKPALIEAIFGAMAQLKDASSIPVCRDFVTQCTGERDEKVQPMVVAAVGVLSSIKHKDSVDALVGLLVRLEGAAAMNPAARQAGLEAVRSSLSSLVGCDVAKADEAVSWWKRNGSLFNDDLSKRPVGYRRCPGGQCGGSGGGGIGLK